MFKRAFFCSFIVLVSIHYIQLNPNSFQVIALLILRTDGQQESSYALLDVSVQASGFHASKICANFQQFPTKALPRRAEDAVRLRLKNKSTCFSDFL
jgi:hypothetical protein